MTAVSLSDHGRRQLTLAKQLYSTAGVRRGPAPVYQLILEVITLDLATETVLAAVTTALDARRVPPTTFEGLVDRADELLESRGMGPLPDRARIAQVHSLRNDAQHRGRAPSLEQASDARTYTRDALEQLVTTVWSQSWSMLSLGSSIRDKAARALIVRAEAELAAGEFQTAARTAYYAMWKTLNRVDDLFVGRKVSSPLPGAGVRSLAMGIPDNTEITRALSRMQRTIVQLAVGISAADVARCGRVTGRMTPMAGREPHWYEPNSPPDPAACEWVVTYCADSVVKIEEQVGDLQVSAEAAGPN